MKHLKLIVVLLFASACSTEESETSSVLVSQRQTAEVLLAAACENAQFCDQRDASGQGHGPISADGVRACMNENVRVYCGGAPSECAGDLGYLCGDHQCSEPAQVALVDAQACAELIATNSCLSTALPDCYYELLGL